MNAYNVKLIKYPNGSAQLRKYNKPLRAKQNKQHSEMFTIQEEWILQKGGSIWKNNVEYVMSPFDKSIVANTGIPMDESKKETCSDSNLYHSLNRTKNKIYTYARCIKWDWFVTFTFSPEKVNRYDFDECSRVVRRWLNNQRVNAPDLHYLVVPEQCKDGAWHFHALLANTGKIKFTNSGIRQKGKIVYNMPKWSKGFSTATAVDNVFSVSKYIGKYITKDLCEITKGKQRYFVSQNLPDPEESTFLIDENIEDFKEFLSTLTDSLGLEVSHVSTCKNDNAFVGVDYYELQDRIIQNESNKSI